MNIKDFTKEIAIDIDQMTLLKGNIIYNMNLVRDLKIQEDVVTARVQSTDAAIFRVSVTKTGDLFETNCNCPSINETCEHIAALFIYMKHNRIFTNDEKNLITGMQEAEEEIDLIKDEVKKLDFTPQRSRSTLQDYIGKLLNKDTGEMAPERAGQKYRLVFKVEKEGYFKYNYHIMPAVRYVKRDGSEGRFENYSPHKVNGPLTKDESMLLTLLWSQYENYQKQNYLQHYLGYLADNPELQLYLEDVKGKVPLTIHRVEKTRLSFVFFKAEHKNIYFAPIVHFCDEAGNILGTVEQLRDSNIQGPDIFFTHAEGLLFYKKNNLHFANFFQILIRNMYSLKPVDIEALRHYCDEYLANEVEFDFNISSMKIVSHKPKPFIRLNRELQELSIELYFDYIGKEFLFEQFSGDEEKFFPLDESETTREELLMGRRNKAYEVSVKKYLDDLFSKYGDTKYFMNLQRTAKPDYTINISTRNFLIEYGSKLLENGIEIQLKDNKEKITSAGGKVAYRVSSGIDWFDVETSYEHPDGTEEDIYIESIFLEAGLLQVGQTFTIISEQEIDMLKRLQIEGMDTGGKMKIPKLDLSLINQLYTAVENKDSEFESMNTLYHKLENFNEIKNYPLPKKFKGTLRHYQEAGYNWLLFMREYALNGCLADDMGLGKTVQTLALLQKLKEKKELGTSLLVVPVSTIPNWESEIERFTALSHIRHAGSKRFKAAEDLMRFDIIIVSYHTMRNDIKLFNEMEFDYIILDEAQNIKNAATNIFKAVRVLHSKHRLTLTGTPVENNTMELWAQIDFLNPGLLGTRKHFVQRFARPIEETKDRSAAERLRKLVFPFILRRKKEDVAQDLPEKEEIIVYSEMGAKQRKIYEQYRKQFVEEIEESIDEKGVGGSTMQILEGLLRLRQISLFPGLVSDKYAAVDSCKFDMLIDMIDEILQEDHKVLIFSQFVKSLKIIERHYKEKNVSYSYIDGSTKNRDKQIKQFQENKDIRLFFISIKAGGVGINLTAADYVILFDPWWNPAVESQAIDRTHRIGQTRKVIAYKMITKDTVEEKMLELQEKKKALVKELITEEKGLFKSLTKEDIIDLFE
ncbi:MAG: DEAD/DEAH box helicase [bacterium]|nr:DEAD/DEAH box helicase [bacterium]